MGVEGSMGPGVERSAEAGAEVGRRLICDLTVESPTGDFMFLDVEKG
jgi:hypothetical protein